MSEHVISHPTPEEREADNWVPGEWEIMKVEGYVVTKRRIWVRTTVECTYEYMTRIE